MALTFSKEQPKKNPLNQGAWWPELAPTEDGLAQISVEQFLADNYDIKLGDTMAFRIGATEIEARVTSIRDVDWSSFEPNFYIIFEPGWLDQFPYTYMTGIYLPSDKSQVLNQVINRFANVSVFSADILLAQIRKLIDQVSKAIEAILIILVIAGIIVVVTGVRSTLDERLHECALMRTFGANYKEIMRLVIVEFAILGFISGFLGALGAEVISWYLHTNIFELDYLWNPAIWFFGPLAGVLLIGISGTMSCLPSVRQAPIVLLRRILN